LRFFHEAALILAERLRLVGALKQRHLSALDVAGAKTCADLVVELCDMADRFSTWPSDPERVATERPVLAPRLMDITHQTNDLVESLPAEARSRLPK
jgi:hypothetical protein